MKRPNPIFVANKVKSAYLAHCKNIVAVTIGGSQARKFSDDKSDIEMFVYYTGALIPKSKIQEILSDLNAKTVRSNDLHFSPYPWGIATCFETSGIKVELVYRNIKSIEDRMKNFVEGNIFTRHGTHDVPFGHYESGVASCLAESKVIYEDKQKLYSNLVSIIKPFPKKLRREIIDYYFQDAYEVLYEKTRTAVERNDHYLYNATISFVLRSLVITLFALNNTYFPGDKWNQKYLDKFKTMPKGWNLFIKHVLSTPEFEIIDKIEKTDAFKTMIKKVKVLIDSKT